MRPNIPSRTTTTQIPPASTIAFVYLTIEQAAPFLQLTPEALRARCRRAAGRVGRDIVAQLVDGVIAIKFGRSWRVRFPEAAPAAPGSLPEPRVIGRPGG
jgi:hypothetical protein